MCSSDLPLSLPEVCQDLADKPAIVRSRQEEERFARHLVFGGYPSVWLSGNPETLLTDLLEAMVLRDASDLFRIARPDAFRQLLRLLAGQTGSLVNLSEWASVLGISRDTVASYLDILESSHLIVVLAPFAGGKRVELTARPKVFLLDNGLRNRLLLDFRPLEERTDAGALLESWVATELWKILPDGATLHFWRSTSGAEVDFVLARGDRILPVEVKASRSERPLPSRSLRSFLEAYQPPTALVLNLNLAHSVRVEETAVEWILPNQLARRSQGGCLLRGSPYPLNPRIAASTPSRTQTSQASAARRIISSAISCSSGAKGARTKSARSSYFTPPSGATPRRRRGTSAVRRFSMIDSRPRWPAGLPARRMRSFPKGRLTSS